MTGFTLGEATEELVYCLLIGGVLAWMFRRKEKV